MKKIRWTQSIAWKHFMVFGIVIIMIIILTTSIQIAAMKTAREATYDRMHAQTEYYLGMLDNEFRHARNVQLNFFNDRKLMYIASPKVNITEYEKRDALLSVKEHMDSVNGISNLISDITLYLPRSDYVITASTIRRSQEADREMLLRYEGLQNGIIYEDESEFFMLENGETKAQISTAGSYLLVVTYAKDRIMQSMQELEDQEGGGAFFYSEKYGITQGKHTDYEVARKIADRLQTNEDGAYRQNQDIIVNGEHYLIFIDSSDVIGTFIQFAKERTVMEPITNLKYCMYIVWLVIIALAVGFICYTKYMIHKPMNRLLLAFERMRSDNLDEHIEHDRQDEFGCLYDGFNEMSERINHLVNEVLEQKNLIQRAELKQMQAQINPHFLYNSFFVLSRRVKRRDYEGAERFAVLLGNYFKFLTRNGSDEIDLEQEVEHARCYGEIQATRFRARMEIRFGTLPEEYHNLKVPRLILQPLLENSFGHGLENKMQDGMLNIEFSSTTDGILFISVEDNGDELTDEKLQDMKASLEAPNSEEITGIINIHKRLKLYFMGNAGLLLDRSELGGLKVSVWIRTK